jgi:hypothetical protein
VKKRTQKVLDTAKDPTKQATATRPKKDDPAKKGAATKHKVVWYAPQSELLQFTEVFRNREEAKAFAKGLAAAGMDIPGEDIKIHRADVHVPFGE